MFASCSQVLKDFISVKTELERQTAECTNQLIHLIDFIKKKGESRLIELLATCSTDKVLIPNSIRLVLIGLKQ